MCIFTLSSAVIAPWWAWWIFWSISRPLALLRNAQLPLFCDGILFIFPFCQQSNSAPLRRHGRLCDTPKSRGGMVGFVRDPMCTCCKLTGIVRPASCPSWRRAEMEWWAKCSRAPVRCNSWWASHPKPRAVSCRATRRSASSHSLPSLACSMILGHYGSLLRRMILKSILQYWDC